MTEQVKQVTVVEMLRTTGQNTAEFMNRIAAHIEYLENHVAELEQRISELEGTQSDQNAQ